MTFTVVIVVLLVLAVGAVSALASGPVWAITSASAPTNLTAAISGEYVLTVVNVGDGLSSGAVTVTDALPAGLAVAGISGEDLGSGGAGVCTVSPLLGCSFAGVAAPGDVLRVAITVDVLPGAPASLLNSASVSGGGAVEGASATNVSMVGGPLAPFGVSSFLTAVSGAQAAGHPNLMTSFTLNQVTLNGEEALEDEPSAAVKDVELDLPPGMVGNPTAVPTCTANGVQRRLCPSDTAVGVVFASLSLTPPGEARSYSGLVYNVVPYPSEPAAFMFQIFSYTVRLDTSLVVVDGEYRVHVSVRDVNGVEPALSSTVTLWGVPADFNGPEGPDSVDFGAQRFGGESRSAPKIPFLTSADHCGGAPQTSSLELDSWRAPGVFPPASTSTLPAPMGCGVLSFDPSLSVEPESLQAGLPTGYGVDLKIPQNESPEGLATPDLKNATVSLPPGVTLNPSAANGLEACTAEQIGIGNEAKPSCPNGSDIGTVSVTTPLLASPLTGRVFIGQPSNQGTSESIPLYLGVEGSGVLVKIAGTTTTDPGSGQITATFKNNPQLPFSDLHLQIKGGLRAPLVNPQTCGTATTTSDLSPWSAPYTADASPSFAFNVSYDGNGAPCPGVLPFAPSFAGGTTSSARASSFSPFSVTVSRQDGQQTPLRITVHTLPGLLGMLSQVPLCPEPQAALGTCGPQSLIGHTTVAAGVGPDPFWLGGSVYLTGPYSGAPFGLSVVVPAVAGPFNLGNVVVRAAIHVDPTTAALTIVSDPLPQMLQGIPLQVRTINVLVDRPGFMFLPTDCDAQAVAATVTGSQGTNVSLSTPFQANDCALLPFHPAFKAQTQGKASANGNGASLLVNVSQKTGEANIHKVDVQLPKLLPARLKTLQKACTEKTFNANPATCPAASDVGSAKAITLVLNVPLVGPAYLVSHGGAKFPELVVVLQGQGVTIELHGETDIKGAITYSRFETVPDAPISSFQLRLPEGPHSALAAPAGSLCGKTLNMPTTITGQNGAVVKQTTRIKITGCPAKHRPTRKKGVS